MEANTIITLHEDEGYRTALVVAVGPKFTQLIWADSSGMKIHKLPTETIKAVVLEYPLAKAKKSMRRSGHLFGITKSAKRALRA
jgi:hypothetical protein